MSKNRIPKLSDLGKLIGADSLTKSGEVYRASLYSELSENMLVPRIKEKIPSAKITDSGKRFAAQKTKHTSYYAWFKL